MSINTRYACVYLIPLIDGNNVPLLLDTNADYLNLSAPDTVQIDEHCCEDRVLHVISGGSAFSRFKALEALTVQLKQANEEYIVRGIFSTRNEAFLPRADRPTKILSEHRTFVVNGVINSNSHCLVFRENEEETLAADVGLEILGLAERPAKTCNEIVFVHSLSRHASKIRHRLVKSMRYSEHIVCDWDRANSKETAVLTKLIKQHNTLSII